MTAGFQEEDTYKAPKILFSMSRGLAEKGNNVKKKGVFHTEEE